MDDATIAVYEQRASEWEEQRAPRLTTHAAEFGRTVRGSGNWRLIADLGCGPGWYARDLGPGPVVAVDGARAMLDLVPRHAPDAWRVQADLAALPFRPGALDAAWASKSYVHLARHDVPLALADLHRSSSPNATIELILFGGDMEHGPFVGDDFAGRLFSQWRPDHLIDVIEGAGFMVEHFDADHGKRVGHDQYRIRLRRLRTLPDYVGPDMRVLLVGLNPSLYSADAGMGFARPGNRFWPAAMAAGLVTRERDPWDALTTHRVGMTDMAKRATVRADELTRDEYRAGHARLERLVAWLQPRVVCIIGLSGWRVAANRKAVPGVQADALGGRPVYLMPNTSGLNARVPLSELTQHLRAASELAG
jgi:TDG/mug DNA glycosylase family protein